MIKMLQGLMDLNTESIEPCGNMPKSRDRRLWKVSAKLPGSTFSSLTVA